MISTGIGIIYPDQIEVMFLADLLFDLIAMLHYFAFQMFLAIEFDCQDRQFFFLDFSENNKIEAPPIEIIIM